MLTYCWNTKNLVEYQNYALLGVVVNSFKDAELSCRGEASSLFYFLKIIVSEITSKNHEKKESS